MQEALQVSIERSHKALSDAPSRGPRAAPPSPWMWTTVTKQGEAHTLIHAVLQELSATPAT